MGNVRDIGSRLELCVDDWLIEEMDGAALRLHQPIPREVVLQFDRPWESPVCACSTLIVDEGRYRMWYRAGADAVQRVADAESGDGIQWERVTANRAFRPAPIAWGGRPCWRGCFPPTSAHARPVAGA